MVAESFKRCRTRAGLSLDEAAQRLRVPASALARYEDGAADPDAVVLRRMAVLYDCTSDELLDLGRKGE